MAKETLTARIALDGGKEIKKELEALGKVGEDAFKALQAAANKVGTNTGLAKFSAAVAKLRTGLIALRTTAGTIAGGFAAVGGAITRLETGIIRIAKRFTIFTAAITAAGAGIVAFIKSSINAGNNVSKQAEALGITADAYQQLQQVARETEIEQGRFETIMAKFNLGLAKTDDAAKKADDGLDLMREHMRGLTKVTSGLVDEQDRQLTGFGDLSVSIIRLSEDTKKATGTITKGLAGLTGKDPADRLVQFALRIAAIQDPIQRLAAVSEVFGKKIALDVLPFLLEVARNVTLYGNAAGNVVPGLTAAELATAKLADEGLDKLTTSLINIKNHLGLVFAPALLEAANRFNQILIDNQATLISIAGDIASRVLPVIKEFFAALSPESAGPNRGIPQLRDDFRQFATDLKSFAADLKGIVGDFATLVSLGRDFAQLMNRLAGSGDKNAIAPDFSINSGGAFGAETEAKFQKLRDEVRAWFAALPGEIAAAIRRAVDFIITEIGRLGASVWDGLVSGFQSAVNRIRTIWQSAIDFIKSLIDSVKNAAPSPGGHGAIPGRGFASGGFVRGPGGETGDKIPALLSNNEFVIRAAIAKKIMPFLAALNAGRIRLADLRSAFRGLSVGGTIEGFGRAFPRFAMGGPVSVPAASSGRPVTFVIGGQEFGGFFGEEDAVSTMARFSATRQAARLGRKPSWVGG